MLNPITYTEKIVGDFLRYQRTTYPFADTRLHDLRSTLLRPPSRRLPLHAPTLPEHPETATRFWSACDAVVKCSGLGLRAVMRSVIPKTTEWGMELGFDDGSVFQVHQIRFDNRIFSVATA